MQPTLYYVHDPMCSWCWAFRPVLEQVRSRTAGAVAWHYLLGGLAPDSTQPMPAEMQDYLQQTWSTIQQRVPGTRFNFEFWTQCQPRRSTYPACRAVIAARAQQPSAELPMIEAIQHAYYLEASNPSERETLISLAVRLGLDQSRFSGALDAAETQDTLDREIARARAMGVSSFPSLVLEQAGQLRYLRHDYRDPGPLLKQLEAAGVSVKPDAC